MSEIKHYTTAPEDRISIETRVTRFDEELIRNAVLREINRGGQIFFVHNRVNDIHVIRERLERMGVAVEPFLFEGGHEWGEPFNQAVGAFLKRLAR